MRARALLRRSRRLVQAEAGQSLVLFAAGMVGMCGIVGLSVDIGLLQFSKTDMQKAVDAAALAGAQDLASTTPDTSAASTTATAYLNKNLGNPAPGVVSKSITFSSAVTSNDTITVTASKPVQYTFLKVLGINNGTAAATATARVGVVTGFAMSDTGANGVFPYAVWGGTRSTPANGCPYNICTGSTQTYRANDYQAESHAVAPDWDVNGNNFKGYFHAGTGVTQIAPNTWQTFSSGGNAMGQEPTEELDAHIASGEPIILPVVQAADCTGGCGTIQFKIVAWVALRITSRGNASQPWTGTVVSNYLVPAGVTSGASAPPANFPAIRTISMVQ